MKLIHYLFIVCVALIYSCGNNTHDNVAVANQKTEPLIQRTTENFENCQLLRSVEYTIKINKLNFSIRAGLRSDSTVALKFNYYHPLNFKEHLKYQKMLMDSVMKDFGNYKFRSVFLGRLIYTGDFCLDVSEEVLNAKWDGSSYPELKEILDSGVVLQTFQPLFNSYNLNVSGISFEKAFLTDGRAINEYAKVTSSKENLPTEILDAMFWIILE